MREQEIALLRTRIEVKRRDPCLSIRRSSTRREKKKNKRKRVIEKDEKESIHPACVIVIEHCQEKKKNANRKIPREKWQQRRREKKIWDWVRKQNDV
ncbi:hypothetical protein CDAR_207641 [Caerostris darwini]|uniref:Uncharacterized protein n=1 Tax=Caerostris darwini TaxID=1538125 RepID=A0AAV4WSY3_9ARAC|nr:hypothetical protein CDAR_207641 [Caerostris darwini]